MVACSGAGVLLAVYCLCNTSTPGDVFSGDIDGVFVAANLPSSVWGLGGCGKKPPGVGVHWRSVVLYAGIRAVGKPSFLVCCAS